MKTKRQWRRKDLNSSKQRLKAAIGFAVPLAFSFALLDAYIVPYLGHLPNYHKTFAFVFSFLFASLFYSALRYGRYTYELRLKRHESKELTARQT